MEGTWLNFGALGATGTLRTNPLHAPGFLSKMSRYQGIWAHLAEVHHVRVTDGTEQCRFERPQMNVFEKTVQKQATLWITVGKRTGFEPLFGPFLDTF